MRNICSGVASHPASQLIVKKQCFMLHLDENLNKSRASDVNTEGCVPMSSAKPPTGSRQVPVTN